MHDIFLSYTGTDSSYASYIHKDLESYGADVWFDKVSMPADHHDDPNLIRGYLHSAMSNSKTLVLLVSARSMASRWVKYELDAAIALEARHPSRRVVNLLVGRASQRDIPDPIQDKKVYDLRDHFEQRYHRAREDIFRDALPAFNAARFHKTFN